MKFVVPSFVVLSLFFSSVAFAGCVSSADIEASVRGLSSELSAIDYEGIARDLHRELKVVIPGEVLARLQDYDKALEDQSRLGLESLLVERMHAFASGLGTDVACKNVYSKNLIFWYRDIEWGCDVTIQGQRVQLGIRTNDGSGYLNTSVRKEVWHRSLPATMSYEVVAGYSERYGQVVPALPVHLERLLFPVQPYSGHFVGGPNGTLYDRQNLAALRTDLLKNNEECR